ncbi:MAG: rhodanese-like domain-containing protein [Spirochaetota bacterium]
MRTIRRVSALLLLVVGLAACSGTREPGALIDPQDAYELVQNGEATLVDVRGEEAYAQAHLAGAVLVPLMQVGGNADRLAARERTIITYCSCPNEETSIAAADQLIAAGFDDVLVLRGGIRGWAAEGLPLRSGTRP